MPNVKRKPARSTLPGIKPGQEKHDYSTPTEVTPVIAERQKKRRKVMSSSVGPHHIGNVMVLSKAMAIAEDIDDDASSSSEHDDKAHRFLRARVELIVQNRGDTIMLSRSERQEHRKPCHVCTAPMRKLCICGHELVKAHRAAEASQFFAFAQKPPVFHMWDCQDNVEYMRIYSKHIPKHLKDVDILFAIALFAGVTGKPSSLLHAPSSDVPQPAATRLQYIIDKNWKKLHETCGPGLFRAGQYNATFPLEKLASVIEEFAKHSKKHHQALTNEMQTRAQAVAAFKQLIQKLNSVGAHHTAGSAKFPGVDDYFNKKILEHLLLLSFCGRFGLKLRKEDLDSFAAVWPTPRHTHKALQRIFPALPLQNSPHAIRLLQKTMHKPPTAVMMTALLCFWDSTKFQWHEWH